MHDATSPSPTDSPTRPLSAVRDEVVRTGRALAAAEVARARALAEAGHLALDVMAGQRASARAAELALREVASELAAAENLSDRSLQRQITRAMSLVDDYPATLAAWEAGTISRTHAYVIADIGQALPAAVRAELDQLAVTHAPGLSPGRLRSRLAVLAERLHPTTLTERHQRGRDTRCVRIVTGVDGMSDLVATLPTVLAVGIYDRLTQQARAVTDHRAGSALGLADPAYDDRARVHPGGGGAGSAALDGPHQVAAVGGVAGSAAGAATSVGGDPRSGAIAPAPTVSMDERTTAQLRADIFADLLLTAAPDADPTRTDDGLGTLGAIRARIQVVVPALSILDPRSENSDPADLVGHGPIDAQTARDLAESTTTPWDRVVTHPSPAPCSTPIPTTARPRSIATSARATATAAGRVASCPPSAARSTTPSITRWAVPPPSPTSPICASVTTRRSSSRAGRCDNSPAESSSGPRRPAARTPTNPCPTPPRSASCPTTPRHPIRTKISRRSDLRIRHPATTSPGSRSAAARPHERMPDLSASGAGTRERMPVPAARQPVVRASSA